jgi:acetyl esterase/lipase
MRKNGFTFLLILLLGAPCAVAEMKTDIEYTKPNGVSLTLDVNIPDSPGQHPVAILVHGGGWSDGDKSKDFQWLREPLTQAEFTWFSINYRLAPQYRWPAGFDDVQTAIRWVKANASRFKGDPKRIALVGYSAGGHLVCLAVTRAKEDTRVQAVVGAAPPTDLELDLPQRGGLSPSLQKLLNRPHELTEDARQILHDISPVNEIKPGMPPFLLIHGTADKSVLMQDSLNFQAKLRANGVSCDLITLKGAPHKSELWDNFDTAYKQQTIDWLRQKLGEPTTQPSKG